MRKAYQQIEFEENYIDPKIYIYKNGEMINLNPSYDEWDKLYDEWNEKSSEFYKYMPNMEVVNLLVHYDINAVSYHTFPNGIKLWFIYMTSGKVIVVVNKQALKFSYLRADIYDEKHKYLFSIDECTHTMLIE